MSYTSYYKKESPKDRRARGPAQPGVPRASSVTTITVYFILNGYCARFYSSSLFSLSGAFLFSENSHHNERYKAATVPLSSVRLLDSSLVLLLDFISHINNHGR